MKPTGQNTTTQTVSYPIRGRVIAGLVMIGLLGTGVFGWAARANLAGAVVVAGEVSVDRDLRVIQHRDGGIVKGINAVAGDFVAPGDVLITLDDTRARTERAILHGKIAELSIRKARLEAQRDLLPWFALPSGLDDLSLPDGKVEAIRAGEQRIFEGTMASFTSRRDQIQLGIVQVQTEVEGLLARRAAKEEEIALVAGENARIEQLVARDLTVRNAVFTIKRENVRLSGEHGEILSSLGRARSRVTELELEILSLKDQMRTEAQRELREIEAELSEMAEQRYVIEDTLLRTTIRAPIAGRINDLHVNSIGGVISPAEVLATIVPVDAQLIYRVRVPAAQIEQVAVDNVARLRFVAFAQNETPEIVGKVSYVAAAATSEPDMPGDFFTVNVEVSPEELDRLGGKSLRPGMPLEVYITTEERTALSYFVKPLSDQVARAFKER
jgi:HlyD family type I secretion membrane fusion protein